ncbi:hypothetical protein ACLMJK_000690 [Lecanora helva]
MTWSASSGSYIWTVIALSVLYLLTGALHRLYFHPLARFPGPKLAALTSWYEFYYDCFQRGKFTWEIKSLHKRYGPIVRITPHELHINDPSFSDEIFSFRAKLDRYEGATQHFGMEDATVFTVPYDKHRLRRGALAPFFARSVVSTPNYASIIRNKVEKLCFRLEQARTRAMPVNIGLAFKCLATDVISEYALGASYNLLDTPDFSAAWFETQRSTGEFVLLGKHFPWLIPSLRRLPTWLITLLSLEAGKSLTRGKAIGEQVTTIFRQRTGNTVAEGRPTLFHHLLDSNLPPQEKTIGHLTREAIVVIGAGSDTTGIALAVTTFHVLDNPNILARLQKELDEAIPDPQVQSSWAELEKLQYLTAVIKEGFRLAYGTSDRLPRVSKTSVQFGDWVIPPNIPISMSPMLVHENESLFPNSQQFRPGRWLELNSRHLDKYLMSFGKGPRACLGVNLAQAELYVTLATVFRRFDLELFDTTRRDVDAEHDFMVPCPRLDSKGVRVLVNYRGLEDSP